jgi:uncharacterized protein YndB with AHSA1/START domain
MTRFGVMNHLTVLEGAGLITTRRAGRSKLHYLNPMPIRDIQSRWIDKYARRVVDAMSAIAATTERTTTMQTPSHVYTTYIKAPAEAVWNALWDGDQTVQYFYGTRVESTWEPGAPLTYRGANGDIVADGTVISFEAPTRLEMLFHARWDDELAAEGPVREVWLVEPQGPMTKLSVELWDVAAGSKTYTDFVGGFPYIVAGLKTLLETGTALSA